MFEGYVGIRLWDGQIVEDVLFSILVGLLLLFAFSARLHAKSFLKMFRCISFLGREGYTTEMSVYYNKYFSSFMTFQALLLASLWVFLEAHQRGYTHELTHGKIGLLILATFLLIGAYYLCRRIVYHVLIYPVAFELPFDSRCMGHFAIYTSCLARICRKFLLFVYRIVPISLYLEPFCDNL